MPIAQAYSLSICPWPQGRVDGHHLHAGGVDGHLAQVRLQVAGVAAYEWLMEETKGGALAREGHTAVVSCRHYSQENYFILVNEA